MRRPQFPSLGSLVTMLAVIATLVVPWGALAQESTPGVSGQSVRSLTREEFQAKYVETMGFTEAATPGGTLIVIAGVGDAPTPPEDGPPWPLTRAEVESFASGDLRPIRLELVDAAQPGDRRWRAEFERP